MTAVSNQPEKKTAHNRKSSSSHS